MERPPARRPSPPSTPSRSTGGRVFGVPTFFEGEEAVFIRFMERGRADDLLRALDLLDWTRLNEFKRTTLAR